MPRIEVIAWATLLGATTLTACAPSMSSSSSPSVEPRSASMDLFATEPALEESATRPPPPDGPQFVVWGLDEQGELSSLWVGYEAGEVKVLEQKRGVFIATDSGLAELHTDEVAVPIHDCDEEYVARKGVAETGAGERLMLSLPTSGAVEVAAAASEDPYARELDQTVHVVGSVGTQLFVRRDTYVYACGAHGWLNSEFIAYDIKDQRATPVLREARKLSDELLPAALEALESRDPDSYLSFEPDEVVMEAVWPRYRRDGSVVYDVQFTVPDCYACSDGQWGSYTTSVMMEAPEHTTFGTGATAFGRAPWLADLMNEQPDFIVRGWSELQGDATTAQLDRAHL